MEGASTEAEPALCELADGVANVLVPDRVHALRATGNGVVAVQGAAALVELARRAGLSEELGFIWG